MTSPFPLALLVFPAIASCEQELPVLVVDTDVCWITRLPVVSRALTWRYGPPAFAGPEEPQAESPTAAGPHATRREKIRRFTKLIFGARRRALEDCGWLPSRAPNMTTPVRLA